MRKGFAIAVALFAAALYIPVGASAQTCESGGPTLSEVVARHGPDLAGLDWHRRDFAGKEAADYIETINAIPPVSDIEADEIALIEVDGMPSAIVAFGKSGGYGGYLRLPVEDARRVFGRAS